MQPATIEVYEPEAEIAARPMFIAGKTESFVQPLNICVNAEAPDVAVVSKAGTDSRFWHELNIAWKVVTFTVLNGGTVLNTRQLLNIEFIVVTLDVSSKGTERSE